MRGEKEAQNLGGKGESKTIAELRRHVNILERSKQRKLERKEKYTRSERKYNIKQKGEKVRIEELKQRLQANSVKKLDLMLKKANSFGETYGARKFYTMKMQNGLKS